jgi:predicted double-glycine peptidase
MSRIGGPFRQLQPQVLKNTEAAPAPKAAVATPKTSALQAALGKNFLTDSANFKPAGGIVTAFGFGTAPTGAEKLSPNDLGVLTQHQGNTNACGTTSLANVMTYWGSPRTHEQIDKSIRAFDMFTAPDKLVEYARDNGMRAELKNDATLDDITKMVDQGVPPMVLMDPDGDNNAGLHYVTVSGYNRDANGKVTDVVIADSATGRRYTMGAEEFQKKWDNLKMANVGTGLNNVMITVVPRDNRMISGADGVQRRASDIKLPKSSFLSNLKSSLARGVANFLSNVTNFASKAWNTIKTVGNAIGNAAQAVGNAVGNAAKAVGKFFKRLF